MYQKPVLQRFGTFRELTQVGLNNSTDGGSIFGISSPGCSTRIWGRTFEIGCPAPSPAPNVTGPVTS